MKIKNGCFYNFCATV